MGLKFAIAAQNNADVLARVVVLFDRLAIDIESISIAARGNRREATITITINGHSRYRPARRHVKLQRDTM
jgi:acetolactate synthase small subunit